MITLYHMFKKKKKLYVICNEKLRRENIIIYQEKIL